MPGSLGRFETSLRSYHDRRPRECPHDVHTPEECQCRPSHDGRVPHCANDIPLHPASRLTNALPYGAMTSYGEDDVEYYGSVSTHHRLAPTNKLKTTGSRLSMASTLTIDALNDIASSTTSDDSIAATEKSCHRYTLKHSSTSGVGGSPRRVADLVMANPPGNHHLPRRRDGELSRSPTPAVADRRSVSARGRYQGLQMTVRKPCQRSRSSCNNTDNGGSVHSSNSSGELSRGVRIGKSASRHSGASPSASSAAVKTTRPSAAFAGVGRDMEKRGSPLVKDIRHKSPGTKDLARHGLLSTNGRAVVGDRRRAKLNASAPIKRGGPPSSTAENSKVSTRPYPPNESSSSSYSPRVADRSRTGDELLCDARLLLTTLAPQLYCVGRMHHSSLGSGGVAVQQNGCRIGSKKAPDNENNIVSASKNNELSASKDNKLSVSADNSLREEECASGDGVEQHGNTSFARTEEEVAAAGHLHAERLWLVHPEGFTQATLLDGDPQVPLEEGVLRVRLDQTGEELVVREDEVEKANAPTQDRSEDLSSLRHLNLSSVLHTLRQRYGSNLVHTYAGPTLLVMNPATTLAIYSEKVMSMFRGCRAEDMPPHIYSVGQSAYREMVTSGRDQSVLLLGRSGAGKTTAFRHVLHYLALASGGGVLTVERLNAISTLLEAFGNGRSLCNTNATRFTQVFRLQYDHAGMLASASVQVSSVDAWRVARRPPGQPNYHILYQLLAGAGGPLRTALGLGQGPPTPCLFLTPLTGVGVLFCSPASIDEVSTRVTACRQLPVLRRA